MNSAALTVNERLAKLERLVDNILRFGEVIEVDHENAKVKVKEGDWESGWIKWTVPRAGNVRVWSPPSVGERVMVLAPQGEMDLARVLPSVFCDDNPAPSSSAAEQLILFGDEGRLSYDLKTHAVVISPPDSGKLSVLIGGSEMVIDSTSMTLGVGELTITSNEVTVEAGKITFDSDDINLGGEGGEKVARFGDAVNPQTFKIMEGSNVTRSK